MICRCIAALVTLSRLHDLHAQLDATRNDLRLAFIINRADSDDVHNKHTTC